MGIFVKCSNCGSEIEKSPCFIKRSKNLFCGNECRIKFMKGKGRGEDNPNFGKKWTDERKEKQSEIIKSKIDEEYRKNCSNGMKGKSVAEETKIKRKETRFRKYGKYNPGFIMTEDIKKLIGEKSKEKFTPEFKKKQYDKMVEMGYWFKKEDLDPYYFYRELSNWKCNILDYNRNDIEKVNKIGFYNGKTNKKGLVRDHRFSRKSGFEMLVFPEIIRHPINCEFISHGENIRKSQSKEINGDSIDLDQLFDMIELFDLEYPEQTICLDKIKEYKSGKRYDSNPYIK
jgi:hypothetical protein